MDGLAWLFRHRSPKSFGALAKHRAPRKMSPRGSRSYLVRLGHERSRWVVQGVANGVAKQRLSAGEEAVAIGRVSLFGIFG